MATKKRKAKVTKRSKARAKRPTRTKPPAKRAKAKATRRKAGGRAPATEAATVKVPVFDVGATQQLSFAEVLGDIEETMALDKLRED